MLDVRSAFLLHEDNGDVTKFAAGQGIAEEEALAEGMAAKSAEFSETGAEIYAQR
jgi:hypothetical protein